MLAADCFSNAMSGSQHPFAASQVAEKVMRRIEIAKVARNLHDCLAFASFKAQNGWQDRTLSSLQPEITEKLKRKRPPFFDQEEDEDDEADSAATETSSFWDERVSPSSMRTNRLTRPSTAAAFHVQEHRYSTSRKRIRSASTTTADASTLSSWKHHNGLAQSSPPLANTRQGFGAGAGARAGGTMPRPAQEDSPMFDAISDDEGRGAAMLPPFVEPSSSIISSSPPRTPPPPRRLPSTSKQSGADLLLYLANSPSRSPAVHVTQVSSSSKPAPSTPPQSYHAHLPSSVLNTPSQNLGLFNGALQTPGPNFNFADFCNVTPSPGEGQWGSRTPGPAKTPSRLNQPPLNLGNLMVPTSSSTLQRQPPSSQGLALQLGGELLPRS